MKGKNPAPGKLTAWLTRNQLARSIFAVFMNEAEEGRSLRAVRPGGRKKDVEEGKQIHADKNSGSGLDGAEFRVRHRNQLMDFQKMLSEGRALMFS